MGARAVVVAALLIASRAGALLRFPEAGNDTLRFTHLAVAPDGRVYAAAANVLAQLSPELKLEAAAVTGPVRDSPACHASGCGGDEPTKPTDAVNKVLVIDAESGALFACFTVLQGACRRYRLGDVSAESTFFPIGVAANSEDASTFAYVGPERYSAWDRGNVLYVGTTFTNNGEFRHDVPAIASRNLYTLDVAEYSFSKQSLIQIDVKYRDNFLVRYVYGFNASDYAYFVVVQKRSHLPGNEELGYATRLARTCVNDDNYSSYTEVTLQCLAPDGDYNLVQDAKVALAGPALAADLALKPDDPVLVAAFSPSRGITDEPLARSALCVFPLRDVEAKFDENVHMCFNGTAKSRNMGYVSGMISDGRCPTAGTTGNILNFCEVGLKISGGNPIAAAASVSYASTRISSVTVGSTGARAVAFLGTDGGAVKKVALSGTRAVEYAEVSVAPGRPVLPDSALSPDGAVLYALTASAVYALPAEECASRADCSSCLESRDPYCGWCSLERRCTVQGACREGRQSAPRWLSLYTGQRCIDFEQVAPDRVPIGEPATVRLTIRTLPELPAGAEYRCVFGEAPPTDATVVPDGLECPAPPARDRPGIPGSRDHVFVPLSVRSSETNKDFVSRSFAFFDCSVHTRCSACATSAWACNWCVYDNRCAHNASACQRTVISGENNPNRLLNHGAAHCPRVKRHPRPKTLPNNVPKELALEVENLPHLQAGHAGFQCAVTIEEANMMVPARVESNRLIVCDRTTYSYESSAGEYNASVQVKWNHRHYVDTVNVTLYKCEVLGSHRERADCSLCVTRDGAYRCAWCGGVCAYADSCVDAPVSECPKPRIDAIEPLSGPVEGGTLVTIEGSNLGLRREEVAGRVRVGDVPCEIVDFEVSVSITCRTGASNESVAAPVVVDSDAGRTESSVMFSYRDVRLQGVHPSAGPVSGGTQLAITGRHLNVGSRISAYLDDLVCRVNATQLSSGRLICVTSKADAPRAVRSLTVSIDGANRTLSGDLFNYTADPTIVEIKPLRSFVSGGRMITVHGTNLHTVQKPEMSVFREGAVAPANRTACVVLDPSQMECPSPAVNADFEEALREAAAGAPPARAQVVMRIAFAMDSVESTRDLEKHFHSLRARIVYVEDPRVFAFPNGVKPYKGDALVVEGENLVRASDESDVTVTVGARACNVTSLTMTQLACAPPETQPANADDGGAPLADGGYPLVVVRIGRSLRFPLGLLRYEAARAHAVPPEAVAGVAAGAFFLASVFMVALVVYRRKSTKAEREYKRIQIQMDTLESNVRLECKQAFAELQTDMSDLAADLENSGIPTLDRVRYAMKVFFPGVSDHPVLGARGSPADGPRSSYDAAMMQFGQLLDSKPFLLSFVDTLEAQKSFNIRDKVNVASLLTVVLMGKMEYATDVLKSLLLRLIDKSARAKHPQLMLRRTESVVEKMLTNWMALCMRRYLTDCAGPSLFLLFKAVKHQVEKGPVDAITHEARYCLSEERLLREQIDHRSVTLHVVQDDLDEKVQCRVLDCDAISQVKSKVLDALFKNAPFSLRPSAADVDLEWRHGRSGHLVLQDEDLTTKTVDGWRRLNSLAHYGVGESAMVSLVPRRGGGCGRPRGGCAGACRPGARARAADGSALDRDAHVRHLVRPTDHQRFAGGPSERTHSAIPEVFLTRLLSTKGTVGKFVDDFFETALTVNEVLPPAVKWLFDLFDEAARYHGIANPEVVHAWKSNSLPLRFWVNLIKNPDFVFDVEKTPTVDSCLSAIAQTFMDACSSSEHRLCKDSPSNKLLFAKDIPVYREAVSRFYRAVSDLPQISDREMSASMQRLSAQQADDFDSVAALKELYIYVSKYRDQIVVALEVDPRCKKMHLAHKLDTVACTLEGEPTSVC